MPDELAFEEATQRVTEVLPTCLSFTFADDRYLDEMAGCIALARRRQALESVLLAESRKAVRDRGAAMVGNLSYGQKGQEPILNLLNLDDKPPASVVFALSSDETKRLNTLRSVANDLKTYLDRERLGPNVRWALHLAGRGHTAWPTRLRGPLRTAGRGRIFGPQEPQGHQPAPSCLFRGLVEYGIRSPTRSVEMLTRDGTVRANSSRKAEIEEVG